eukprot:jgi/Bigna1/88571/estExt_fgenesh1_pg.C_340042
MDSLKSHIKSKGVSSNVTVNQRKLIDTMLARYAGDYATFRELIQNADDAHSKTFTFSFKDVQKLGGSEIKMSEIQNVFEPPFKNRKISEGNPNEQCVGMFGVGFYSVFSLVDEPLVSSGGTCMLFSWKGSQLVYHRMKDPNTSKNHRNKTIFSFGPLRKGADKIELEIFKKFLVTALSFTKNLWKITVEADGKEILQVKKSVSNPTLIKKRQVSLPFANFFKVKSVSVAKCCVSATGLPEREQWLISSTLERMDGENFEKFHEKCREILKKNLPSETRVSLLFPMNLDVKDEGKIFVGLSTNENTGCGFHASAHLYPTIERSNVDFQSPHLSKWNQQLTHIIGYTSRLFYDWWIRRNKLELRVLAKFNFKETKTDCVSKLIADGFFQPGLSLQIPSSSGLLIDSDVAFLPQYKIEELLKEDCNFRVIPTSVMKEYSGFFGALRRRGIVSSLELDHLLQHLRSHSPLGSEKLTQILAWYVEGNIPKLSKKKKDELDGTIKIQHPDSLSPVPLSKIKFYAPPEMQGVPVSPDTLPGAVSFKLESITSVKRLEKLKLKTLKFSSWASAFAGASKTWNSIPQDATKDTVVSLHSFLSSKMHELDRLRSKVKSGIFGKLSKSKCIPVKGSSNMLFPKDTYLHGSGEFPCVDLEVFRSRSTTSSILLDNDDSDAVIGKGNTDRNMEIESVNASNTISMIDSEDDNEDDYDDDYEEKHRRRISSEYLLKLGVKKSPEIRLLVENMLSQHIRPRDVLQNLISIPRISKKDIEELKTTAFLPCIELDILLPPNSVSLESKMLKGVDQFSNNVHTLSWIPTKKEECFLQKLGVSKYPKMKYLFSSLETQDKPTPDSGKHPLVDFFLENFEKVYSKDYNPEGFEYPFIPGSDGRLYSWGQIALKDAEPFLHTPHPEFIQTATRLKILGRLKLKATPSPDDIMNSLERGALLCENMASALTFLGERMNADGDLKAVHYRKLAKTRFIPVESHGKVIRVAPSQVFLCGSEKHLAGWVFTLSLPAKAADFLKACKAGSYPKVSDLVEAVLDQEIWNMQTRSPGFAMKDYIQLLENIAEGWRQVNKKTRIRLQAHRFLVGCRKSVDNAKTTLKFVTASDCYLVDNKVYEAMLKPWVAPVGASNSLERMYEDLGAKWLTSAVQMISKPRQIVKSRSERAQSLESLIRRRAPLLVRSRNGDDMPSLVRDSQRILGSLKIKEAKQIVRELTFEGKNVELKSDAADISMCTLDDAKRAKERSDQPKTLYLLSQVSDVDYFDVGTQLAVLCLKKSSRTDVEIVGTQMAQVLAKNAKQLAARGWPVERFIKEDLTPPVLDDENFEMDAVEELPQIRTRKKFVAFHTMTKELKSVVKGCKNCSSDYVGADSGKKYTEYVEESPVVSAPLKRISYGGTRLYIAEGQELDDEKDSDLMPALTDFLEILQTVGQICRVNKKAVNVFLDKFSDSVAFNKSKSLFFNLGYYKQVHYGKVSSQEAIASWYVTMCHELAHNKELGHNKAHESLMEQLITGFMPSLIGYFADGSGAKEENIPPRPRNTRRKTSRKNEESSSFTYPLRSSKRRKKNSVDSAVIDLTSP